MPFTIDARNQRSIAAVLIAAESDDWIPTPSGAWRIRSQRHWSERYLVTASSCNCQDAQRHAPLPCKHQLAVQLHSELAQATPLVRRLPSTTREE